MFIFATDLDNTLIYSYKWADATDICIEKKEGKSLCYMSSTVYFQLKKLSEKIMIIPVTTRSLEQFNRIQLPFCQVPSYALVSNGGILLKNGEVDKQWLEQTKQLVADCNKQLDIAYDYLEGAEERNFELRRVDELFLFTKSKQPTKTIDRLKSQLDLDKVAIESSDKKIYVLPKCLTKGLAIKRLRKILPIKNLLAAGDSIDFDLSMLKEADIAIALETKKFRFFMRKKESVYYWNGNQKEFGDYIVSLIQRLYY